MITSEGPRRRAVGQDVPRRQHQRRDRIELVYLYVRRRDDGKRVENRNQTGFRVERILDFNLISRLGWYISGRILKKATVGYLPPRVFDSFVRLWRQIDGLPPWPPTPTTAVAVKP